MLDPENILFVDETGSNTNMKQDGLVGGELHVLPTDTSKEFGVCGAVTDIHFSVLCFTNGLGIPVQAAIILKSSKDTTELPLSWKMGIDIRKKPENGETRFDFFKTNYGKDKVLQGGPTCFCNGKEMPCFVGSSENASITSEMLAAMLETMDLRKIFNRNDGKLPVLLLDGHQSRVRLPFLKYVNDDAHRWKVCLGVPYGTHLWQVGDSNEQNGAFKTAIYKAKRDYLRFRDINNQKFLPTDIVPLVNTAWDKSFAKVQSSRRAIMDRGWNPLNYALLTNPALSRKKAPEAIDNTTITVEADQTLTTNDSTITDRSSPSTIVIKVNTSGSTVSNYLDCLVAHEIRDAGRKRKYEEQRSKTNDNNQRLDLLKDITKISSGQLASINKWTLGPDVLRKVQEKEDQDQQKKAAIASRKIQQQQKDSTNFRAAFNKYSNNQQLTAADTRTLLKKVRHRDDSPLALRKVDLDQQWEKRKHRLDDFRITPAVPTQNIFVDAVVPPVPAFLDLPAIQNMGSVASLPASAGEQKNPTHESTSSFGEI
jgi:hypothetical protein